MKSNVKPEIRKIIDDAVRQAKEQQQEERFLRLIQKIYNAKGMNK